MPPSAQFHFCLAGKITCRKNLGELESPLVYYVVRLFCLISTLRAFKSSVWQAVVAFFHIPNSVGGVSTFLGSGEASHFYITFFHLTSHVKKGGHPFSWKSHGNWALEGVVGIRVKSSPCLFRLNCSPPREFKNKGHDPLQPFVHFSSSIVQGKARR